MLPYKSLQSRSSSSLKRYTSFTNLNILTDEENSDKETSNQDLNANVSTTETESQPVMSWANMATTFITQKVALFEKVGENIQTSSFLERYVGTYHKHLSFQTISSTELLNEKFFQLKIFTAFSGLRISLNQPDISV